MPAGLIDSITSLLELGGPVVVLILVLSIFAVAMILLKLVQFWREKVGRHRRAERALHAWFHHGYGDARNLIEGDRSPAGEALSACMRLAVAPNMPKDAIEDEVGRIALTRLHELQRGLRALDAVAQISPLLGLFGTVLGMIEAFRQLQEAGNAVDPSMLAGGIWVALLTTAAGLAVAMPVSLVLTWFETRVENERVAIETMTSAVLSHRTAGRHTEAEAHAVKAVAGAAHAH
ncbi:MotA/TolQ/ExbB proton channel family protein [Chelativorans sp. AA-79]|uniref:MotA/TolQ/ExbB proton channel family protein n=1 Tax=Chelativorans sp. AA-79 TaxID=3028735 RepID=UPI0023F66409|nr:MotA/TolQ/ExbB proton channel family protein [Chelativorans sp. AA-79]WEX11462.1 MotA/TolQ/ExbB proton channel family protein [Chelativorans sp. AA-79]